LRSAARALLGIIAGDNCYSTLITQKNIILSEIWVDWLGRSLTPDSCNLHLLFNAYDITGVWKQQETSDS
jgi:hypothetical protein